MKSIAQLTNIIAGDEKKIGLQHKLLNISCLGGTILSFISLIVNYSLDLHWGTIVISSISVLVFGLVYTHSMITHSKTQIEYTALGYMVLVFTPLMWFSNGGSIGAFQYFIPLFLITIHIATLGKTRIVLISLLFIITVSLLIIEYYNPEFVIQYTDRAGRYIDLLIGYLLSFTGIIIFLNVYYKQYIDANKKLQQQNKVLEDIQEKIIAQQIEIERHEEELEEKAKTLQELNATKDRFFSIISHDLKNPISVILSLSDSLVESKSVIQDEDSLVYIDLIYSASSNAHKLVLNLLEWARTQTNGIKCERKKLNLTVLVKENSELLLAQSENKGIELLIENGEKDYFTFADKYMVNTIIRNLVSNAIKFTETGSVKIELKKDRNYCIINIIDSGIGMHPNIVDKLFDIDKSITTQGTNGESGTGLGLIICKEFVAMNRGDIYATSIQDKGSIFTVKLPLFIEKNNEGF